MPAIDPRLLAFGIQAPTAQGLLGGVENLRTAQAQNELAQFNLANAPELLERQRAEEARKTSQFQTEENFRDAAMLKPFLDRDDFAGAENLIRQRGDIGQDEQQLIDALQSGDPELIGAVKNEVDSFIDAGTRMGVFEQATAPETFRAATPQEVAGRPEGTVAQVSETTGKLTNIFTPDSVDSATTIKEDANGRLRFVGGDRNTQLVFPDLEVTPDKSNNAKTEEGLRKEFNALVKDFNLVSDSFARVKASVEDPTGAGDLSLIFNFMKMLDPNSVVRESEFATAQNTGNVPNRIVGLYNRLLSEEGKRLSIEQRNDFTDRANKLFDAARSQATKTAEAYSGIAERNDVDVQNVIANFAVRAEQTPAKITDPRQIPGFSDLSPAEQQELITLFERQNSGQ